MREIKFRGKRIDTQEWVYGFPVMVNGGWFMLPFGTPMTQHAYYSDRSCYGIMSSGDVKDLVGHDVQEDNGARMCQVSSGTVGQFTGLKDKNGVEIYEGDIVRILYTDWRSKTDDSISLEDYLIGISHIGTVVFENAEWQLLLTSKNRYGDAFLSSIHHGTHGRIEVIGNIHDNTELLQ